MKYIQLTSWGNNKKHLVPLKAIADIEFGEPHTTIKLSNGNSINVIEDNLIITSLLEQQGASITTESDLIDLDELPF
jgi:uncharacterized protein YlzI (FlbEa/FlbD family)